MKKEKLDKEALDEIIVKYLMLAKNYNKPGVDNKQLLVRETEINQHILDLYEDSDVYKVLKEMDICLESGLFNEEKYNSAKDFMKYSYNTLSQKLYYNILIREVVSSDLVESLVDEGVKYASKDDGILPLGEYVNSYYRCYIENVISECSFGELIGVRMGLKKKLLEANNSLSKPSGIYNLYYYFDDIVKEKVFEEKFGDKPKKYDKKV